MKTKEHGFVYQKAYKIIHWGYSFDSLTELKYALSIQDEYYFLRERVMIHYDPATYQPTDYIRDNIRRYTPDFLIRHKQTGKAYLVEIKPRAFDDEKKLDICRQVADNFIQWKKYDWQFKIVYDDEIILNADQFADFEECCCLKSKQDFILWFERYNRRFVGESPSFFKKVNDPLITQYVMFGQGNQLSLWHQK
jgi:hypothetical protein